jgi:hypothetical protein
VNTVASKSAERPKLARDRRYSTGFPIRCTHEEKREIFARATRARRSASRFLVELGMREEGQLFALPPTPQDPSLLEGLVVQLRRLGTILNELARRAQASAFDQTDSPADADLRNAVREVKEVLGELRSRLT